MTPGPLPEVKRPGYAHNEPYRFRPNTEFSLRPRRPTGHSLAKRGGPWKSTLFLRRIHCRGHARASVDAFGRPATSAAPLPMREGG